MTGEDHYDYTVDRSDNKDTLEFGKFIGCTPAYVAKIKPGYIVWAWESTNKWVGSESLVARAYGQCGKVFKERTIEPELPSDSHTAEELAAFEQTMIDSFGSYPMTESQKWKEKHK